MADKSHKYGVIVDLFYVIVLIVVFGVCAVCYVSVWSQIDSTSRLIARMDDGGMSGHQSQQQKKNNRYIAETL